MTDSRKAREVNAEFNLKVSNSLITAFLVAILILPISGILSSAGTGKSVVDPGLAFSTAFGSWYGGVFLVCEGAIVILVLILKSSAIKTYNDLYPDRDSD